MNLDFLNQEKYAADFWITGLPRSRTAWFAAYFSATGNITAHEPYAKCQTNNDVLYIQHKYTGISDSILLYVPVAGRKMVIIERDPDDVAKSLAHLFDTPIENTYPMIHRAQEQMAGLDGLRVKYKDINDRLQEIHEYCVDTPYDPDFAGMFMNFNITIKQLEYTPEFRDFVERTI